MSIEHVRLMLFLADLDDPEVIAAKIENAYLHGKNCENLNTKIDIGGEYLRGKYLIIDKSFYGLKSSTASWHKALTDVL